MHVYVVHPGADFATADVYVGLVAGLRANNVHVSEGRIDTVLNWYDVAVTAGIQAGGFDPSMADNTVFNRHDMASSHITKSILNAWPDLVIVVSGHNYHHGDAKLLRRLGLKTAILCTESPYFWDFERRIAPDYDYVFTHEWQCVAGFQALNPQSYYLPHAYHPDRHTVDGAKSEPCDVFFVGSLFDERRALFAGVDWTGLTFVQRGHDMSMKPNGIIPNTDAASHYRSAKIALNHHRTTTSHGTGQHIKADEAVSLGPRAYEIAACGAFQLMDDSRREARDVFGTALATYAAGNSTSLGAEIRWWLKRDSLRTEYAAAQHQAVLQHSWTHRAKQLLEYAVN